jgi:antirestriction protein
MQVAKTILEQLGGAGRLQVMTGAYNFVAYPNGVSFKFKNRKVNYVKITLNGMDLYDIEFLKLTVNSQKKVAEFEDIYFDQLIDIFEDTTGMYLRLFAKGGRLKKDENIEMIFGQLKQIHHHEKELRSIIKKDKSIEPWVIAKLQRATTDLADVTHYEDNKTTKYAKGGAVSDEINELIYEAMYPLDVTSQAWGALKMAYYDVDTIEEKLEYIEEARFHTNIDDPLYYKLLELEREIERIQSNEEDEDEYAKGGGVVNYPSFEISKGIPYDGKFLNPGYYTYIDREVGGKGVYINIMNRETTGFSIEDLKLIQEKYPDNFSITFGSMAKGGNIVEYKIKERSENSVIIELPFNAYKTEFDLDDRINIQTKVNEDLKKNFDWWGFNVENDKTYVVLGKRKYAKGGGVGEINIGDEVIWKGNKYRFAKTTENIVAGLRDKKYHLHSYKVGVKDAILDSLKDVTKYENVEDYAKGGGIEDDITRAKSNAIDKIDFEYYAKQHAGDSWNTMSKQEKTELMSELRDNWFNDSYAKGGNIYNYLVGTDFKYLGELHKVKKVEKYPTYTILVTTENRRFRMDILQEQGVKFADKPERKKRQPETPEQKRRKNAFKIKQLQYERKQILIDMEQEAEPEGGPIANRYGRMLNKIDKQIAQLSGKDYFATGGNIEEEVSYIENRIYNLEQLKQVAGEDEQNYYSRLIQDLEREKSELLNKTSSEVPENKKKFWFFKDGGNLDSEKPLIYIEDFDAIYSGKSYGQWLDLSKFDSGQEVMEALSDIASNWSERKGEKIETISVTDYENIPRSLYHEFMSSKDYDFIIKAYKVSKQVNIPMWVVGDVMNDYSDSFEHTLEGTKEFIEENYLGFAEDDSDLAYDYIEKNGGIKSLAEEMIKRNFDYEKYGRDVRLGMDSEQEEELGYDKLDDYDLGKELVEQYSDIRELDEKTLKSNFNYKLFGDYLTSFYANYGGHYFRN